VITDALNLFAAAKGFQAEITTELGPPPEGLPATRNLVIPITLVRGTRGYIERIAIINIVEASIKGHQHEGKRLRRRA
jgi:hypothetical protein